MRTHLHAMTSVLLCVSCLLSPISHAKSAKATKEVVEARVKPIPVEAREDARFAEFIYNGSQVFDIAVSTNAHLHILLDEGEEARHFMAKDKRYWRWEADVDTKRSIYVSAEPGAQPTTATLRTTHGIYEMTLRPVDSGPVFRQVRFRHPDVAREAAQNAKLAEERILAAKLQREADELPVNAAVDKLNFSYVVKGDAPFAPKRVFDDGQVTYIHLGNSQDMPALFENNADGTAKSVAYTAKGSTLIARRVMKSFSLVVDKAIVRVSAGTGESAGFRWPWQP